ncbi:MAG TPA: hypothetical protein VMG11_15285 [Steroidobacteraceae bacterium]|nr:hypothetical protein [Steroidobacteraceae bacterium]
MHRLRLAVAMIAAVAALQGCASTRPAVRQVASGAELSAAHPCADPTCAPEIMRVAHSTEVPIEKNAPAVSGHPLTSVVVTQCNLIVAVYMTMSDGQLLRFDHTAAVSADQLLAMAYTATRSERVEVSCNDSGVAGYETHAPT